MRRVVIGLVALLAVLIAVPAVAYFAVDPAWLKPRIEAAASSALGRKVEIRGPLEFDRGWTLRVRANDVHVANAEWGKADELLQAQTVEASLDLWQLVTRWRIALPTVALHGADLRLERNDKGEANWQFGAADAAKEAVDPEARAEIPLIGQAAINDAAISFEDLASGYKVTGNIDEATSRTPSLEAPVEVALRGDVSGQPLTIDGKLGPYNQLLASSQPYPVDATLQLGSTKTTIAGRIGDPANLQGVDLDVATEVTDATALLQALGIAVPELPDFTFKADVKQDGTTWRANGLEASIGKVEMAGDIGVDTGGPRPKVTGGLHCDTLRAVDIQELAAGKEAKPADGRVIPDAPLPSALPPVDVDLDLRCGRVEAGKLALGDVGLHVTLDDGRLRVDPIELGLAGGLLAGSVTLDSNNRPPALASDVSGRNIALGELLDPLGMKDYGAGNIALRLRLEGQGNNLRSLLANADGRFGLAMEKGQIGALLIEALGLDLAEILAVLVGGKPSPQVDRVPIRCFVADLQLESGTAFIKTFVLDTTDSVITAEGAISLRNEEVKLRLEQHPKDASLLSARAPVDIGGTLSDLTIDPGTTELAARGVAATILGVIATPLAAIIPFVDIGDAKDAPCASLLAEAKSGAKVPTEENN